MDLLCWLLTAAVLFCDPAAQQYAEAAANVPPAHWQLVRSVGLRFDGPASTSDTGHVLLPQEYRPRGLYHEVGHLVAWANNSELGRLYELLFWHANRPRYRTPTDYARTDPAEDFAESYELFIDGRLVRCCPERARFMREWVPG